MAFSVISGRVIVDDTGASRELPVLMSSVGPIRSLVDYCLSMQRSLSWQEKLVRATKLFLEYLEANASVFEEEWRLFRNFSHALRNGTIDPVSHHDPSNLWWHARDVRDANFLIGLLSEFLTWLGREEAPRAAKFNPSYVGTRYDHRIDQLAYAYRRHNAFLGHTWTVHSAIENTLIRGERPPKVYAERAPAFPESRFEELLFRGFKVAGRQNYRDMLITLLMFGASLRVCEPFHLFMADVQPHWDDPSLAFVAVHHPSLGYAPNRWTTNDNRRGSRQAYLSTEFGLTPRNLIRGKQHAGWKHPALDGRWYMHVHWFPEVYGHWFMQLWERYLNQVATIPRTHPYAWINIEKEPGGIYTISQYQKSLQNAVERIGLVYGKAHGTSAHGFRHAFGQRARRGDVHEVILQRLMHHCSPKSQLVYTQPEVYESATAIRHATQLLRDKSSSFPTSLDLTIEYL